MTFTLTIEVTEDSVWLDGSPGLLRTIEDPGGLAVLEEIAARALYRAAAINVVSVIPT